MRRFFKNRQVAKECKILSMLEAHALLPHLSFHTPGHKVGRYDITELSFSDNLSAPKGCILQAEKEIAQIVGGKKSFILTDGSTSGVLSMLHVAKSLQKRSVAFLGNAHKSVYNGCALLGLIPILLCEDEETNKKLLENAEALLLTCPSYYGEIPDLKRVREYCDRTGKLLLIDGAHGGHLRFDRELYAGAYADIWVDGVHKSLPAFTQGAVVSTSKAEFIEKLQAAVDIFRTTSPSYPIMASVEYAVKFPRNVELEREVASFKQGHTDRILQSEDWTKVCVAFGKDAFAVEKSLEKKGIYPEFCDGNYIMFYLSPAQKIKEFKKLVKTLEKLFKFYPMDTNDGGRALLKEEKQENEPTMSELNETEWISVNEAMGRVCAGNCGLFPPCVPLIKSGEVITAEKLALLERANNVFGVIENRILVYKDEKR